MFECNICHRRDFATAKMRDDHVYYEHHQNPGWYEKQQLDPKTGNMKSIEHQLAALKSQMAEQKPTTIPLSPPLTRLPIEAPQGWTKNMDGKFIFERKIGVISSPFNVTEAFVKATVTPNHGICMLHRYDRDLTAIFDLEEKSRILQARQVSLVVEDDAFVEVSRELHNVKRQIKELKDRVDNNRTDELILEEYWHTTTGSEENEKQQTDFMNKVISECDRLTKNFKNEADK